MVFFSKLQIVVNGNELAFEGNFTLDEVRPLVAEWFKVQPGAQDQARLDSLTAQFKSQNDSLLAVVLNAQHLGTTSAQPKE